MLLSAKNVVSHILKEDLKVFRQKSCAFYAYCTKYFLLLHKVPQHYKIIPTCNTSHTSAFSGVIKQLETLIIILWFSVHKICIFATLFRYWYLTLLTEGTEEWKYENSRETWKKIVYSIDQCLDPLLQLQETCIIAEKQSL